MFQDVTVNLATFLNIVTYVLLFLLLVIIYRFLVRKLYVNRIAKKIRTRALKLFSEHKLEYGLKERKILESKLDILNKELKSKYNLRRYPINWNDEDIHSFKSYYDINESFTIRSIDISKNILFYNIKIVKHEKYGKNAIRYKNCVKESRNSKLDDLID